MARKNTITKTTKPAAKPAPTLKVPPPNDAERDAIACINQAHVSGFPIQVERTQDKADALKGVLRSMAETAEHVDATAMKYHGKDWVIQVRTI